MTLDPEMEVKQLRDLNERLIADLRALQTDLANLHRAKFSVRSVIQERDGNEYLLETLKVYPSVLGVQVVVK